MSPIWDHPRACGVYTPAPRARGTARGSSPRVRGLRQGHVPQRAPLRIIPARAGFTWAGRPFREAVSGSSPRVRGLPIGELIGLASAGIIPARAGFTGLRPTYPRATWDHPRACGVYKMSTLRPIPLLGSSPRVRGLPRLAAADGRGPRIIPARAGFTDGYLLHGPRNGDHPRACGVYAALPMTPVYICGSSPRVRGLRLLRPSSRQWTWIIPARAGFTSCESR